LGRTGYDGFVACVVKERGDVGGEGELRHCFLEVLHMDVVDLRE
jgi:hypothetical protein